MKTHSTPEHDFLKSKHKNGGKKKNENKGVSQSFRDSYLFCIHFAVPLVDCWICYLLPNHPLYCPRMIVDPNCKSISRALPPKLCGVEPLVCHDETPRIFCPIEPDAENSTPIKCQVCKTRPSLTTALKATHHHLITFIVILVHCLLHDS